MKSLCDDCAKNCVDDCAYVKRQLLYGVREQVEHGIEATTQWAVHTCPDYRKKEAKP